MTSLGRLRLWAMFFVINLSGIAMLWLAHMRGWVNMVIERDVSNISLAIAAVFAFGLMLCFSRIRGLNKAFDEIDKDDGTEVSEYRQMAARSASNATELLKVILGRKLMWINALLVVLPTLGLLGTVVGITMGLESSVVANAGSISEVVEELFFQVIQGLSVAFYTTIVGMVFMLWLFVNAKMLEIESMRLMEGILDSALRGSSCDNCDDCDEDCGDDGDCSTGTCDTAADVDDGDDGNSTEGG